MPQLKTIQYRGGIAKFQLPSSWVEEYDPRGGGTFYEPGDDTGTLRINVLGFERPPNAPVTSATALLTRTPSIGEVEALPSGAAVLRYMKHGEERGVRLRLYRWEICVCVSAIHFRIVAFTYTILDGQEQKPEMQAELQLLDKLIVTAEYPAVRGVAGDFHHDPRP